MESVQIGKLRTGFLPYQQDIGCTSCAVPGRGYQAPLSPFEGRLAALRLRTARFGLQTSWRLRNMLCRSLLPNRFPVSNEVDMNWKLNFALPCLVAFSLALTTVPAHADYLYVYLGNDYTAADGTTFTTSMSMEGAFSVVTPFSDNLSNVDVTSSIGPWILLDGEFEWNSSDATLETFDVSTDATGAIDGWNFAIDLGTPPIEGVTENSSSASGDAVDFYFDSTPVYFASNSDPGVWSGPIQLTPEPASGLDLALGGLALGLLAFGKRHPRLRSLTAKA
jgi:hypothetical protein